ncbi:hypothetical protein [Conexibacter sp. DBS9H8]|uniref:hypothetical protein n=1 Tax=Conexibacter sp. DBS9H8 TaxID=2937801 RepID=UPI00200BE6E8|nr:hypothetical protein [Conexibacter sp. DBS9H8]
MERGVMLALGGLLSTLGGVLGGIVGGVGSAIVNPIFDAIGHAVGGAAAWMVRSMATFWMSTPTPQLASGPAGQTPSAPVALIQGHLWWYMTAAAVVGVLVGCGRMAWEQRADAGREVLRALAVFVATAGAGLTVIALATTAADRFSTWIVSASTGGNFGTEVGKLTTLTVIAGGGLTGVILVCVFGLLMIVASLIQMVLMVVRGGMLVILAGVLPTTAAFTSTQAGWHWFRKSGGWLVASILYKPAAAIVYATAFSLTGNGSLGSGAVTNVITGLMLMGLAILALPALMKFVAPMVGATAAGGAGAVLGAAAGGAAGGAMLAGPSGALRGVGAGSSAAGGSIGGSGSSPQGAAGAPSGASTLGGAMGSGSGAAGNGATSAAAGVVAGAGVGAVTGVAAATGSRASGVASGAGDRTGTSHPGAQGVQGEPAAPGTPGCAGQPGPAGPAGAAGTAQGGGGVGTVLGGTAGAAGAVASGAGSAVEPSGAGEAPSEGMA